MDLNFRMMQWPIYFYCLLSIATLALLGWLFSLARKNVTHVDSMWSLFLALTAYTTALITEIHSTRATLILVLVTVWALRLFIYLTWRNWGPHEDHRYVQIRKNNAPHFWFKSLYIIFGFQAVLAWLISISLYAAIDSTKPLNVLVYAGAAIVLFGLIWETVADWQLSVFRANPDKEAQVLDTGLWRYSRHPNYFGECCVWWGFYVIALSTNAWWAIISPMLMTLLLLKVSGVTLLEKTITNRRPAYANYVKNTNAFIPGPRKS